MLQRKGNGKDGESFLPLVDLSLNTFPVPTTSTLQLTAPPHPPPQKNTVWLKIKYCRRVKTFTFTNYCLLNEVF